jgi:hypothetical protein
MTVSTKSTDVAKTNANKKPYQRPRLDVYGDIREIARSVGMSGAPDGATHAFTKTQ